MEKLSTTPSKLDRKSPSIIRREVVVIGNYKLGDKLGKGAFSTVYKALNISNGNFVAVKRITRKKQIEESLMREIDLLKSFNHKHIVRYIDLIITENHVNLVLEYVESGSLANVVEKFGVFPESLVVFYIEQVLHGLQYLHINGVAHRDIKGPNLLITKEGIVKLADFGIALTDIRTEGGSKQNMGMADGGATFCSPFWVAPEVVQMNQPITTACDIWSLGCTIIELLTGFPPYYDNSSLTALYRMVEDEHPPFPDEITKDLEDFFIKSFQKNPAQRPTAKDLLLHSWVQKGIKIGSKDSSSWRATIERVKTYNSKKKRDTLSNIQNIDWSQASSPVSSRSSLNEQEISSPNGTLQSSEPKSETNPQPIPSQPTLSSSSLDLHSKSNSFSQEKEQFMVVLAGTETRKNMFFYYTVYRLKVCVTYPKNLARCWFILRSYSDFTHFDAIIKTIFVKPLPSNFPELPKLKFFGNTEPQYVEYIYFKLKEYLGKLLEFPTVYESTELQEFLKPNREEK